MTTIARNGISGLVLRIATITLAAIMFGCAPKASAESPAVVHHSLAFFASASG